MQEDLEFLVEYHLRAPAIVNPHTRESKCLVACLEYNLAPSTNTKALIIAHIIRGCLVSKN